MINKLTLLLLALLTLRFTLPAEDAYHVQLSMQETKKKVYLGFSNGSTDQASFCLDILVSDMAQSSHIHPQHSWPQADKFFQNDSIGPLSFWNENDVDFVLKINGLDEGITAQLLDVADGEIYQFNLSLEQGNRDSLRKVLHRLHDEAHYYITGQEGIASSRLIFCLRSRNDPLNSDSWTSEVFEVSLDGSSLLQKTYDKSYCVTPTLLSSSKRRQSLPFYYVSYKNGLAKIQHWDKYGTRPFMMFKGNQWMPVTTIESKTVAFVSDISGKPDLFIQTLNQQYRPVGKPRQLLSTKTGVIASPTLSPDGSQVVFVSNHQGRPSIYIQDIKAPKEKTVPRRLVSELSEAVSPRWSPDGRWLAFSMKVGKWRQIMLYDFESEMLTQLTDGPYHSENPSWAANSEHIVFNKTHFEESGLFFMHINEGIEYSIPIQAHGDCFFPILEQWDLRKKLN